MIPFHILFSTALVLTVLSGATATMIAVFGDTSSSEAQRRLVERLSHIALLGAGAIIALLSRGEGG